MKRTRYVAVIAQAPEARSCWKSRLDALAARTKGVRWIFDTGPLLAVAIGEAVQPLGQRGVLIGSVFERSPAPRAPIELYGRELGPRQLIRRLIDEHWGGFVAIQLDQDKSCVEVFRGPLGDLPCLWARQEGAFLLGSDLTLMLAAGLRRPGIDRPSLARYLAREDIRTNETCLTGISEIRGGEASSFTGSEPASETLWSPWTYASISHRNENEDAERLLRETLIRCTDQLARDHGHIVLKLSGGLDSSIVAACLKASGHAFTAVNLVTADPSGDEREHAWRVAANLGNPLLEALRDPARISLTRTAAAHLPRPSARGFTQETARVCSKIAAETSSSAIFDGGGGDNVFCSLQSARPAADCLMTRGPGASFWHTAASIAELAQVSLWQVARHASSIRLRRSPVYRWDTDLRFLSGEARSHALDAATHPWLTPPRGMLPGKTAHVALLAAAQSVIEGHDAEDNLPTFSPLIVQPVVEAALAIPSWRWFEQGRNRAAARRAFAGLLPKATLERRSKGAPDGFIAEVYEVNRPLIRTMLKDGVLTSLKLLDGAALDRALDDPAPVRGHDFLRIMRLIDAEAWARNWRHAPRSRKCNHRWDSECR